VGVNSATIDLGPSVMSGLVCAMFMDAVCQYKNVFIKFG